MTTTVTIIKGYLTDDPADIESLIYKVNALTTAINDAGRDFIVKTSVKGKQGVAVVIEVIPAEIVEEFEIGPGWELH